MKRFPALLLLAAATFGAYLPSLRNGIVWDDTALLLRDPFIRSWRLIPEGFQHFLFTDATASDFYRPIQRLIYTLEYAAYGVRPFGYHLTSIACHLAAAVALFFLADELLRLFGVEEKKRRWVPFVAALVWAIHPVHSAAVAYISGRADPLAAAFGFAGLLCGLISLRRHGARAWLWLLAAGAALLLSCLSKEAGLIFPACWFAILLLRKEWKNAGRAAVIVLFVAAIYLSLRLPAEHIPAPTLRPPAPLLVRPIVMARAVAEYACLIFAPIHLHMERDVETHPSGFSNESLAQSAWRELETLAGLLVAAAFVYWLMRERTRERAAFVCLVLVVITYLPISGVVPLNANIAEHWLYLPTAFLFIALGLRIARALARDRRHAAALRASTIAAVAVWVLFLGGRSFVRTFDWKDQRTFLERAIANGGGSGRMLINLAGVESNEGRLEDAKTHLQKVLQNDPDQPFAVLNAGSVAIKQGDYKTARELLTRATQLPVVDAQAHELLAVLANKESGKVDLMRLRLASRTGPSDWSIERRYVKVLDESGATDAAIAELQHCLQREWYRAESWQLLCQLLAKSGRHAEAAAALAQAHRYDVRLDARPKTV